MNLQEWNDLGSVEKKALASKFGVTLKGVNELWSEDELLKIKQVGLVAPIPPVIEDEYVKPKKITKKLGSKAVVKKAIEPRKRGRPVSKLAGRKKK